MCITIVVAAAAAAAALVQKLHFHVTLTSNSNSNNTWREPALIIGVVVYPVFRRALVFMFGF